MRVTDLLLIFWQLAMLGLLLFNSLTSKRSRACLFAITSAILLSHLLIGKAHWQMVPTYLSLPVTCGLLLRRQPLSANRLIIRLKQLGLGLGTIAMIVPVSLFPVFQFAQPTGSLIVGTTSYTIGAPTREPLTNELRSLKLRVYYPAESKSNTMFRYQPTMVNVPDVLFSHYNLINTNAYVDAPLKQSENYPLLTYSHGTDSYEQESIFQLVEMASYGYVIVAIDHGQLTGTTERIALFQTDISFVLDQIQGGKTPFPPLTETIDFSRVGVMGIGDGGMAATEALVVDSRIRASINLDGNLSPTHFSQITKPFLGIYSTQTKNNQLLEQTASIVLSDANALSFTDFSPASSLLTISNEDSQATYRQINQLSLTFFDEHLQSVISFDNNTLVISKK